jgi:hypothetical protein
LINRASSFLSRTPTITERLQARREMRRVFFASKHAFASANEAGFAATGVLNRPLGLAADCDLTARIC